MLLHFLSGREQGICYYGEKGLESCESAMWVLANSKSLNTAYARMQLLFSPSKKWKPQHEKVRYVANVRDPEGAPDHLGKKALVADGQAEISLDAAILLGFLSEGSKLGEDFVCDAWQFRGLVRASDAKQNEREEVFLTKGMLVVNPALEGACIRFFESACKMQAPGGVGEAALGMDITKASGDAVMRKH